MRDKPCSICDKLTDQQKSMLSTPQYQIRKDKKSGLLVSPSKVTVVGVVDQDIELEEDAPAHSSTGSSQQELFTVSHHSADGFVSKQDFDLLSNQLEEKFARFEALFTHTNIFSMPKVLVSTITAPVSEQPFFNQSDPRATAPVRSPGLDEDIQVDKPKEKKNKGSVKKGKKAKTVPSDFIIDDLPVPEKPQTGSENISKSTNPTKVDLPGPGASLSLVQDSTTNSGKASAAELHPTASSGDTGTGQDFSTAQDYSDVESLPSWCDKDSEDGEISDSEANEQNEEMNYRETLRAVRAFLSLSHIPDFELSVADGDRSDNPWKGKHPRKTGKVSVELPANDWLCHKMEKLNTRVAEGYPSRSQESAGLKLDHFIALIHPIQWTIANPVGADRPAKRQKKTSCVSTGWPVPVLGTLQMAPRTSFLSRQPDVIASFSFGACTVHTCFQHLQSF